MAFCEQLWETAVLHFRFGQTLFFEHPISNPFGHEERFVLDIRNHDDELKLVTGLDEWMQLRAKCRPCTGSLGEDPVEAEMFDVDGYGNVQVVLLPQEQLHLPFSYLCMDPNLPALSQQRVSTAIKRESKEDSKSIDDDDMATVSRTMEVRILSGTHGLLVGVLCIHVHPRPFVIHRTLRLFEAENSVMKRRMALVDYARRLKEGFMSDIPNAQGNTHNLNVVVMELDNSSKISSTGNGGANRVVVEWSEPSVHSRVAHAHSDKAGSGTIELALRFRCDAFPSVGSFYLLLYEDSYQINLLEVNAIE